MKKIFIIFILISILLNIQIFAYKVKFIPDSLNPSEIRITELNANYVQIAGNWNNWASDKNGKLDKSVGVLLKNNLGEWYIDVRYFPNDKYSFKLIVDGKWQKETWTFEITKSLALRFGNEITCYYPGAKEVLIAGDWNNWCGTENGVLNAGVGRMIKDENNIWHYILKSELISEGVHKYKFIINGKFNEGTPNILIIK